MKSLITTIALITVSLVGTAPDVSAGGRGPEACGEKRGKLVSVAVKDLAKCMATKFGPDRGICEERAQEKLDRSWTRQDSRYDCSNEEPGLGKRAGSVLRDLMGGFWDEPSWGLPEENPPIVGVFNKVVFFAPFCDFGPRDHDTEASYNEAVAGKGCFPDLQKEHQASDHLGLYRSSAHTGKRELNFRQAGLACQRIAINADLPRADRVDYDVWVSNEYIGPDNRFERSEVPYVLPSGVVVAKDWDDLTDQEIRHPIDEDALGRNVGKKDVLTGTDPEGVPTLFHANNWSFSGWFHTLGSTSHTVQKWTSNGTNDQYYDDPSGVDPMDLGDGVYCFQQ